MESAPAYANLIWVLVCAAMVMLMQAGFCMLETGFSRAKNSINVAIKNLIDFCLSGLIYWAFGFGLMFGSSCFGLFGGSLFALDGAQTPWLLAIFLFQMMFCSTATTIISGAVAERIRFSAYLLVAMFVSAIIYPVFGHWAWGGGVEGVATGWLAKLGFVDFAGSTVVHSVGGWCSLAITLILGPRFGRFTDRAQPMHGHSLALSTLGALTLWFGWFGFNGGSTLAINGSVPIILVNTNLAAAAGGVAALLLAWRVEKLPSVTQGINGVIAGLVGITASCHLVEPIGAVTIGAVSGLIAVLGTYLLERCRIDDVVGAVPVHGMSGAWGTLAVALFVDAARLPAGNSWIDQLGVQSLGILVCFGWSFAIPFCVFSVVNYFRPLRTTLHHELQGLNVTEHGASTELIDLLVNMDRQSQRGDFSQPVHVEPHTEVGQIAAEYNRVIDRVNQEIIARERAIEAARQAEEKFRSIFENAVEGIFQTTPEGEYLSANPKLARIYGFETVTEMQASLQNISRQLYVDPARRAEFCELLEETDVVIGFESQVYRADGSIIWISENARAIRDELGNVIYYEGSVEEVTQRKLNADLQAEKEAAVAASKAKSAFLANMSHEIRTPLNGVIGMLELLGTTTLDDRQNRYVHIARSSAGTLLGLINDVLDFSKIEAGKLELERMQFDLHVLLEDVAEMFSHRAGEKGLELSCRILPNVPVNVYGDPERIRQVLINLVNNAIKFTKTGEVILRADEQTHSGNISKLRISVIDTGIGIPADRCSQLFAPFTQVDASTTRKYGGTGLGLAICRQLIELMGGRVGVDSVEGNGSTFWCEIPFEVNQSSAKVQSPDAESLRGLAVLTVDDTETNLEILHDQLSSWGMRVSAARDGLQALAQLRTAVRSGKKYPLVILDHQMPEMDGLQLAAAIKGDALLRDTSLLMLTSVDQLVDRTQWANLGLAGVMTKPIRQSRLFDAIADVIKKSDAASSTPNCPITSASSTLIETGNSAAKTLALEVDNAVVKNHPSKPAPQLSRSSSDSPQQVLTQCGLKILVAEDNEINQLVTCEILRGSGYACDVVSNGNQAIDALARGGYALVLMDCQMPELDGFAATQKIRQLEASGQLQHTASESMPIVALTANAVYGDRDICLAAGMNDYTTKPVDRAILLSTIARNLQPVIDRIPVATTATKLPEVTIETRHYEVERPTAAAPSAVTSAATTPEAATTGDVPPELVPVLELPELLSRCASDTTFAASMLRRFQSRLPQEYARLADAVKQGDTEPARKLAHTLKGTAANLAAGGVRTAAAELEQILHEARMDESTRCLDQLEFEVNRCLSHLDTLLAGELAADNIHSAS